MNADPNIQLALKIESGEQSQAVGSFLGHVEFKTFTKIAAARKAEVDHQSWEHDLKQAGIGVRPAVPDQKMPHLGSPQELR